MWRWCRVGGAAVATKRRDWAGPAIIVESVLVALRA